MSVKYKPSNRVLLSKAFGYGKSITLKRLEREFKIKIKTIETAIQRGTFSKELSYRLADVTGINPLFWQSPGLYNELGEKRE